MFWTQFLTRIDEFPEIEGICPADRTNPRQMKACSICEADFDQGEWVAYIGGVYFHFLCYVGNPEVGNSRGSEAGHV